MHEQTKLTENLMALHEKLEKTEAISPDEHHLLTILCADIRRLLGPEWEADQHTPLSKRLAAAIEDLEEQHPALVTLMRDVSDMLSNLGI